MEYTRRVTDLSRNTEDMALGCCSDQSRGLVSVVSRPFVPFWRTDGQISSADRPPLSPAEYQESSQDLGYKSGGLNENKQLRWQ